MLFTAFDHDDVVAVACLDFSKFWLMGSAGLQFVGYFLKISVQRSTADVLAYDMNVLGREKPDRTFQPREPPRAGSQSKMGGRDRIWSYLA